MPRPLEARGWTPRGAADLVTLSRLPIAAAILVVALADDSPSRLVLMALLGIGIVSDVGDGWLARRWGTASERGARLDSAADAILTVAVAVAVVATSDASVPEWMWWAIGSIAGIRLVTAIVTAARFRVASIAHTWGNKAAGVAVAAAAMAAFASGRMDGWPTAVACAVAGAAAVDELVLVSNARSGDRDVRGAWDRS